MTLRTLVIATTAAAALAAPASAPAQTTAGTLTVGLSMPSEGFQVGVVAGTEVRYARGLEIDLARDLARRLELGTRFVQTPFAEIVDGAPDAWDVALAQVSVTEAREGVVDFSVPYMRADEGVLMSQFVTKTPKSLAGLRGLRLCSQAGTTGSTLIGTTIKPTVASRTYKDVSSLLLGLQIGRCDAVVYDLPTLATLKDRAPRRYGTLAGKIVTGEEYAVVLPKGSALKARVDAAITAMRRAGVVAKAQRRWLARDLSKVRSLR